MSRGAVSGTTQRSSSTPPRVLTIAGSDSGGGAGIQADLKTFDAFGVYGMSVVTAITAQNTIEVTAVHEVPPDIVAAQIDAVAQDIGFDAVKIGMLASAELVEVVAERLRHWCRRGGGAGGEGATVGPVPVPVVLDPVMVSKSGVDLLSPSAVDSVRRLLLPLASVVTPNLPEAQRLSGLPTESVAERLAAARRLLEISGLGAAARGRPPRHAVLLKGGHGQGEELLDLLVTSGGERGLTTHRFVGRRRDTVSTHGTGCTLSSAIAAGLAVGKPLAEAVEEGVIYLRGAIDAAFPLGRGHGPVDHLYRLRRANLVGEDS